MDIIAPADNMHKAFHVKHGSEDAFTRFSEDYIKDLRCLHQSCSYDYTITETFTDSYRNTVFVENIQLPELVVTVFSEEEEDELGILVFQFFIDLLGVSRHCSRKE